MIGIIVIKDKYGAVTGQMKRIVPNKYFCTIIKISINKLADKNLKQQQLYQTKKWPGISDFLEFGKWLLQLLKIGEGMGCILTTLRQMEFS